MSIEVTSTAFDDGGTIPKEYTCDGDDRFPSLEWSGVPAGTMEQALIVEDPDAPGGTFTHLVVVGFDFDVDVLESDDFPAGTTLGTNDFGGLTWGGPCPPEGDTPHRYIFRILALSGRTELVEGFSPQEFHDAVEGLETGRGELLGRYGRG